MSSSKVFCFYRVKSSGDFQALAAANISINGGSFSTGEAHTLSTNTSQFCPISFILLDFEALENSTKLTLCL